MKKIAFLLLFFANMTSFAQNQFSVGGHVGIPMMDASKISNFNLGLDISYLYNINTNFKIGAETGYSHFFIDTLGKDMPYIPIAAKAQYTIPQSSFFADVAVGYGISVNRSMKSGVYINPKIGYKLGSGEIYLGLQTLFSNNYHYNLYDSNYNFVGTTKANASLGSINLGYNFTFK